ncbi:MAG TPA: tetratricopeptide repeat protein [Ohtaekwangia sp.]|uniref:tetratricopeptide repeat protein n=1 Tax=Ohtaekwangia sp. TaxID=2066019 RepID=UPI002F92D91A
MKPNLSFLFLFVCSFLFCHGQDSNTKKLKQALASASDEEQYVLLTNLAWEYRAVYPDSGIYFGQKAYTLGKALDRADLAKPLNFIGLSYYHRGDHLDAYDYYTRAIAIAGNNQDSLQLAHAYNNLGRLFMEQGVMPRSYAYLTQARDIFQRLHDLSGLAYSYQSLAGYHKIMKDIPQAEQNYLEAYRIRLRKGDAREITSAMVQLGKLYMDSRQTQKALYYFQKGDSLCRAIGDALHIGEIKTLTAECLLNEGDLEKAEVLAREGLQQITHSQNLRLLPGAYLTMGQIQLKKGNIEQAKEYFRSTLGASTLRSDLNTKMEAYFFLWQTFRQQGNGGTEEFDSYTQYMLMKDSVRSLESVQHEEQLKFKMEIARIEQENELLRMKEQRKTVIIFILAGVLIVAAIMLYMQMRYRLKILRVNHLLEERNHDVKKINELLQSKNATLEKHMTTLVDFSKNRSIHVGNLAHAARDIATITAKKLQVSQVSIWLYQEDKHCIESLACYSLDEDCYRDTMQLSLGQAPVYFEAIKKERMIVADDARIHPMTREFTDTYFIPGNIYSLLDVSFSLDGQLKGLLCCEQLHTTRTWTAEDKIFASSVADIITLAFRTSQRLEYEKHIKDQNRKIAQMNDVLEERVKERTAQLKMQNQRLSEYAFINSHLLRGPLSRILGLINLIEHDKTVKEAQIIDLLRRSGNELDDVVKKITDALNEGEHPSMEDMNR